MAQDLALSLLWCRFNLWPRELLHALGTARKKKKKKTILYKYLKYTIYNTVVEKMQSSSYKNTFP